MPQVFVTQGSSKFDLSALDKFGFKHIMFSRSIYADEIEESVPKIISRARRILKSFKPDEDYIGLAGDPLLCVICCIVAVEEAGGRPIRVLKYDKVHHDYFVAVIDMGGETGIPALNSLLETKK